MALYASYANHRTIGPQSPAKGDRTIKPVLAQIQMQCLAEEHFDNYDFELALSVYHEQVSTWGRNPKLLFNIAQIHLLHGEHKECASWLEQAIIEDPFMAVAYFQLGGVYVYLGKIEQAKEKYDHCKAVVLRGKALSKSSWELRRDPGSDDVTYEQLGMGFTLRMNDINGNRRLCRGIETTEDLLKNIADCERERTQREFEREKRSKKGLPALKEEHIPRSVVTIAAGTIFRLPGNKADSKGYEAAKTADWRFRPEARVVAERLSVEGMKGEE